jgi:hypothetical protein
MDDDGNGGTTARGEAQARATALRELARQTASGGAALSSAVEEALRVFGSERALLLAVHQRWQVHLLARVDQVLECGSDDRHGDVLRAVTELSRAMPGFAALLREHADDPLLASARQRLAAYVDLACPCGRTHPLVASASTRRPARRCVIRHTRALVRSWRRRLGPPPAASFPPSARHVASVG